MDIILDPGGMHSPEYTAAVANAIPEAVRVLNHATINRRNSTLAYPAGADAAIAALATAAQRLPQLLDQIREWLTGEFRAGRLRVTYSPQAGDPGAATLEARIGLSKASAIAGRLHAALKGVGAVTSKISAPDDGEEGGSEHA
jgi:hypothetical protein